MKGLEVLSADEFVIELGEHCIETTAKRIHMELMGQYLEGVMTGTETEEALDVLARFLGQTDFRTLRANHPALAGGTRAKVKIYRNRSGDVLWEKLS